MLARWTAVANRAPNARAPLPRPERMSQTQAIEQIIALNPTATPMFLSQFRADELRSYLDHLLAAQRPRGREARWCRPEGPRAIVASARAA